MTPSAKSGEMKGVVFIRKTDLPLYLLAKMGQLNVKNFGVEAGVII
jgi:hypothetical protein